MPEARVTVVVPTLTAGAPLLDCVRALERQTRRDFELILVDNSGKGLVRSGEAARVANAIVENGSNLGFGAAVNQGYRLSRAPFLTALNDDAIPDPDWLAALAGAAEARPDVGMCASRVVLSGEGGIDSAGMLLCADGTSKQRGHGRPPEAYPDPEEVLLPSASAALYRRDMLEEIGLFDEDFFLYCEDTDIGLRARWAGWKCLYVPAATVEHRYSQSAGRASALKASYVERNRLFVVAKTFPARMVWRVPIAAAQRYFWHVVSVVGGRGAAAEFLREGNSAFRLLGYVVNAHLALFRARHRLRIQRRMIRAKARISAREFQRLAREHSISPRQVAYL